MRQGFKKNSKEAEDERLRQERRLVEEGLRELGFDMDTIRDRRKEFDIHPELLEDGENFSVEDSEDDFSVEFYQSFLNGTASVIFDGPERVDYDAFVAHARKVCGYDKR